MSQTSEPDPMENKKDLRIQFLEEQVRWNLLVSEILISLGDLHHQASLERKPEALFRATMEALQKLAPFKAQGFFLVNEEDSDFDLLFCNPEDSRDSIQQAVDFNIEEGVFAWALYQNKPVMAKPGWENETLVLHVLATQRRVRGMFAGLMEGDIRHFPEKSRYPVSLVLQNTAKALESLALYDLLHSRNRALEDRVRRDSLELKEKKQQWREEASFRTLAEESLILAKEQLEQALAAKDEFLANISHELRSPLDSILGYAQIVIHEMRKAGQEEFVEELKIIEAAGQHLLLLVNDLLDLVNLESGTLRLHRETFYLEPFLNDLMATLEPLAEQGNNVLSLEIPPDSGSMHSDPVRVRQVLLHLLSNACKYTREGRITLSVARERQAKGDYIKFVVTDTGMGIDPEKLDQIFEKFTRGPEARRENVKGTGLGLPICKQLTDLLGGSLEVRSEPGKGSVFTLRLPCAPVPEGSSPAPEPSAQPEGSPEPAPMPDPQAPETPPPPPPARKETPPDTERGPILIGEEDPVLRNLLARFLEKKGFVIDFVSQGEALLEKVQERPPAFLILGELEGEPGVPQILTHLQDFIQRYPSSVVLLGNYTGVAPEGVPVLSKPIDWDGLLKLLPTLPRSAREKNILIVESDPVVREILSRLFVREGWSVEAQAGFRLDPDQLRQSPPRLLLMEVPGDLSRVRLFLEELRRQPHLSRIPVFLITARNLNPEDLKSLDGEVQAVFKKGHYTRLDLLSKIQAVCPA